MSDAMFLGVGCLVFGAFSSGLVGFLVWLVRRVTAALEAQDRQLAAYASARGHVFTPRPPRVRGVLAGVPIEIGVSLEGPARQSRYRTCVAVLMPGAPGAERFELGVRGPTSALSAALGGRQLISTGDPAFDGRFALVAADPATALAELGAPLRARLLGLPRELRLERSAAGVVLSWPGYEDGAAVLDEAAGIVVALAGARAR